MLPRLTKAVYLPVNVDPMDVDVLNFIWLDEMVEIGSALNVERLPMS
jgi:hypothetical protein